MKNKSFAALILTHGRPDNVVTYNSLRKHGYTGDIVIVIDNEDKTADQYKKKFENVYQFDKLAVSQTFDTADNFDDRRTIVYARNASFDIAKKLGYEWFIQLDDDYINFELPGCDTIGLKYQKIQSLDCVFDEMIDFVSASGFDTLAMMQGGDWIGGRSIRHIRNFAKKRKSMNSFVCRSDSDWRFFGRINEDVNTYTRLGNLGKLLISTPYASLTQKQTQSNSGGMTDVYQASGTYIKSFYSVMYMPSSVKIGVIRDTETRIHHSIDWNTTVPKIIRERFKR